jgi:squalene-associated FAD-dependent desaturase
MSRVVVVGGGLAGISAALECADAGCSVTLVEAKPRLGGLTYSFRRGELEADNGQHVFLRCCTAYRAMLDRLGVADQTVLQERLDIPVLSTWDGNWARLRRARLPAPWHLGSALLGYRPLRPAGAGALHGLTTTLRAARAAFSLRGVDCTGPETDRRSFGEWLRAHGQDSHAIEALWDLIGVATLNARAEDASLALAAMVFQVGLLTDASAADIGWSRVPLGRLHGEAARSRLTEAGATVLTGTRVTALRRLDTGWVVDTGDAPHQADQVIVAVPPAAAEAMLPPGALPAAPGWAAQLGQAPIVNVHIVLSERVLFEPFVAVVGSPVQWVFDRTEAAGLAGGQYLALSISAADRYVDEPVARLRELFLPQLARVLPGLDRVDVLDFFVTRERAATFRSAPGQALLRPGARTRVPGLFLAGAWTDTGWPATMEGAVRSGVTAARAALDDGAAIGSPQRGVMV